MAKIIPECARDVENKQQPFNYVQSEIFENIKSIIALPKNKAKLTKEQKKIVQRENHQREKNFRVNDSFWRSSSNVKKKKKRLVNLYNCREHKRSSEGLNYDFAGRPFSVVNAI